MDLLAIIQRRRVSMRFDGYRYHRYRIVNNITYLRCELYRARFCRGRGRLVNAEFTLLGEHNHPRRYNCSLFDEFRNDLREECRRRLANVRTIYNTTAIRYAHTSRLLPFVAVRQRMNRWQREAHIPLPQSLDILRAVLLSRMYGSLLVFEKGVLSVDFLNIPTNYREKKAATITEHRLVQKIGSKNDEPIDLYVDTNQLLIPPDMGISKIMTWIVPHENHSFPIIWNLINNENALIYEVVVRSVYGELTNSNININIIYYNFDQNLYRPLSTIFQSNNIQGSFTSHCQILLDCAKNIEGIDLDNSDHQVLVKKFICLSILPSDLILPAFLELCQNLPIEIKDTNFHEFIEYYCSKWLNSVGTNNYSFFQKIEAFNSVSYTNWKKTQAYLKNNLNIWNFCKILMKWFNTQYKDVDRLEENAHYVAANHLPKCISNSKLRNLWTRLNENLIDSRTFLAVASNLIDEFFQDLIFNQGSMDTDFELVAFVNLNHNLPELQFVESDDLYSEINLHDLPNGHRQNIRGRRDVCSVCGERDSYYRFRPCGHAVLCRNCYEILAALAEADDELMTCPYCRGNPQEVEEI